MEHEKLAARQEVYNEITTSNFWSVATETGRDANCGEMLFSKQGVVERGEGDGVIYESHASTSSKI